MLILQHMILCFIMKIKQASLSGRAVCTYGLPSLDARTCSLGST